VTAAVVAGEMWGIPRQLRDFQARWERWKSRGWTFSRFPRRVISTAKSGFWAILARMSSLSTIGGQLLVFENPRQMHIFPDSCGEPENLAGYLQSVALSACDDRITIRELGGGVSSVVLLLLEWTDDATRRWVVKQSLGKLRVRDE
jgi:hypothetical protein